MDPDLGYWIRVWENTLFWPKKCALLGRVDPLIFSAKVVSYCGGQIRLFLVPKWRPAVEGRSEFGKLMCQSGVLLWRADPLIFGAKMAPCCGGQIRVWETHLLDLGI
jgi:hypothetical protein